MPHGIPKCHIALMHNIKLDKIIVEIEQMFCYNNNNFTTIRLIKIKGDLI